MKKTLLAAAVLTSFVSGAQAGVTVFKDDTNQVDLKGRVYAGYVNQENNDSDTSNGSSDAYFRLGFKTKSQLTETLKAISQLEMQWAIDDGGKQNTTKTRLAYAGTQADWGTITFGRQYVTDELVADWTDSAVSNVPGNDAINAFGRESNVLKFEGTYIKALTVGAHAQLESDQDGTDKSGFGAGVVYAFDFGLDLGATYGIETKDDVDTDTVLLGAQYKRNALTAAIVADMTSKDNSEDSFAVESSLAYKFGKFSVVGRYLMQDIDGEADYAVEQFTFGGAYKFNKNFRIVSEYVADQVEGNEDALTFAARYDF
ncbi:MAG: putative porin [Psychromonas sp.]|jgi:predicted porin|uniref:porin n=1 Tax=Psychromonas sp. TaxID=1884585 RepID=UPI0039E3C951